MACYSPLSAKISKHRDKDGKKIVKILSKISGYGNAELPCGKCIGCKLAYSRDWANRCYMESTLHKENWFITLTYRPLDEPTNEYGELELRPRDLMLFMKRLRRHYSYHHKHKNIRFFACGEYGANATKRPHYHLIVFNLPLNDLVLHKTNKMGDPLYTSKTLDKIWDKGWVVIGNANWESAAYTARYIMKKQIGKKDERITQQEFVRMSRSPGIGKVYYDLNKEKIYNHDYVVIPNSKGVHKMKPPHYFDRLQEKENPKRMYALKESRFNFQQEKMDLIESTHQIPYARYVNCEFDIVRKKALSLKRDLDYNTIKGVKSYEKKKINS